MAVKHSTVQVLDCCCTVGYKWWNIICCTVPGLTRPCIYCIYIKRVTCKMEKKKTKEEKKIKLYGGQLLLTVTDKRQARPLVKRARPTKTRQQNSDRINIWSQVPRWARRQGILTDWPSVVTWPQTSETLKYGYGFWETRTIEWLNCKLQTRPLVREGAPQIKDRKFQTATFWQELISGRKSHKGARYQDILTDCQS
jgi:hypothetical protein